MTLRYFHVNLVYSKICSSHDTKLVGFLAFISLSYAALRLRNVLLLVVILRIPSSLKISFISVNPRSATGCGFGLDDSVSTTLLP